MLDTVLTALGAGGAASAFTTMYRIWRVEEPDAQGRIIEMLERQIDRSEAARLHEREQFEGRIAELEKTVRELRDQMHEETT